jgi:hypothetical protein
MLRTLLLAFVVAQATAGACSATTGTTTTATTTTTTGPTLNMQSIVVNAGPANNYFNGAFTSVLVCVPGQSACQLIDGVLVDTGSSGLRVLASALTLSLPQQADAAGAPTVECNEFVDGITWGPIQMADVKLAGEVASNVPIQVIGSPAFSTIPKACSNVGPVENTLATLGANGILGVSVFRQDCGQGCTISGSANPGVYYACPASGCVVTTQALTRQVQNPVWLFPADNNGVMIQLPVLPPGGALTATGALVFGIGTQADNALGSARVMTVDQVGNFTTTFNGVSYATSFIDSGSNGVFFLDTATTLLPVCADSKDFYCPPTLRTLTAINRGVNAATSTVTFNVGNADTLNGRFSAFNEVAGPFPGSFDWGLSFFFGRTIFTAIEGQSTPGGTGPYWAY